MKLMKKIKDDVLTANSVTSNAHSHTKKKGRIRQKRNIT
jgi:hypothetical protein